MLCAKYDYKTDIAVKQEEAFQDGMEKGLAQGTEQKALEAALLLIKKYGIAPETAAKDLGISVEKILSSRKCI